MTPSSDTWRDAFAYFLIEACCLGIPFAANFSGKRGIIHKQKAAALKASYFVNGAHPRGMDRFLQSARESPNSEVP